MEQVGTASGGHPSLNLTPEEKRVYGHLLKEADPDGFGAVSGDVAVKFFERTRLPPDILGQIWQIADTENRGFLTPAGFGVVLRLIGHAQAGRAPSTTIAPSPAPLPKFEGGPPSQQPRQQPPPIQPPAQPIVQQNSGVPSSPTSGPQPVRVPALGPDKVAEYSALFEKSGAENGVLPGLVAKQIFERARLPIEVLGRIWSLADVQGKGSLDVSEFVIAMHLLAAYKSGAMRGVPNTLPPGLLDAATRRPPVRLSGPPRPSSATGQPLQPLPQQFTAQLGGRPQSPIVRQQMGTPLSAQSTGEQWLVNGLDKQRFDQIFSTVDTAGQGFVTGEQAVQFFGNARLPEEILAQVWDLADINSDGLLNRDEFAVAMFLIRQQRGSKDGRLPQSLPAALVPPSMRKQQMPSQPSTMPVFDDAPITKPKSAVEDLFGLDVSENPAPQPQLQAQPQVPQSTGGTDAGPFANSRAVPAPTSSPPPPSFFTPFQPKSNYGQGLVPQSTGFAPQSQQKAQPERDLMDNDEEAPAKINNDAAELGNLSNQVGNLSKQMTDLQGQRGQAEQEIAQTANQKRAFQERLTQLRAAYDQEVQQVKSLKEQLASSQTETKRVQTDMAMIDAAHADLRTQHQQLSSALMADQSENTSLKERIRQTNTENEQLKPQLEKLKSDARQQKGLVAINKKQLATNEAERDRIRAEMAAAQKEAEEAKREIEETARQVEASQKELEQARNVPLPVPAPVPREFSPPPQVASPTPSTASSNPFFRKQESGAVFSPPMGSAITSPAPDHERNTAFDNIFGPSFGTAAPAPVTSFGRDFGEHEARSETLKVVEPPPAEPANQFEPSALPFRSPMLRGDSTNSSVKVAPPASRLSPALTPRALTPDTSTASPSSHRADDPFASSAVDEQQESIRQTLPRGETLQKISTIPGGFPDSRPSTPGPNMKAMVVGAGAATIAAGAGAAAASSHSDNDKGKAPAGAADQKDDFDNFFSGPSHKKTLSEQRADFDSAFDSFGASEKPTASAASQPSGREFPDIQELDDDDDEDSSDESEEDGKGFDDNFTAPVAAAPQSSVSAGKQPEVASAVPSRLQAPPLESRISNAESLPDFEQQKSPPDYKDAVPKDNPNHFPLEYKNLLPEREDPTSPPSTAGASNIPASNPAGAPPSYGPEVGQSRSMSIGETAVPAPNKSAPFDFDSAFQNLGDTSAPAEEEESDSDYDDRTPGALRHQAQSFDFDPNFDSPANSTRTTNTIPKVFSIHEAVTSPTMNGTASSPTSQRDPNAFSSFDEFNSNPFPPTRSGTMQSQNTTSSSPAKATSASHDWDSLFAPLESQGVQSAPRPAIISTPTSQGTDIGAPLGRVDTSRSFSQATQIGHDLTAVTTHQEVEDVTPPASQQRIPTMKILPSSPMSASQSTNAPSSSLSAPKVERPKPGRALTEGTEHDDPILKRLTSMGWSRNDSLAALEKFDYNIDKAADYLTFKS